MKTEIQDISQTKKKINISVPQDEVVKFRKRAYQKVSQKAKIKGFRPGKIPENILDKYYGSEVDYECLNFLVNDSYQNALKENEFFPVDEPKFDVKPVEQNTDYFYSIDLEIKPKFELKDYTGIEIKKQTAVISDEELNEELKRLQENLMQLAPAPEDATFAKGLVAQLDFEGKVDGVAFEGGTAKDFQMDLEKGQLLPEFEEKVIGMKVGEERTIEITFPEDYFNKELAGKKAEFAIKIKSLHAKSLPVIDDEFAKDLEKENLVELKKEIENMLVKYKERSFRGDYAEQIKKALLKKHDFEVPESIVQKEVEQSKKEKKEVEDNLKMELILEAIAKKESFKLEPQELEQRLAALAQMYRQPVAQIRDLYMKNNMLPHLVSQILVDKALDFAIDNAKMV